MGVGEGVLVAVAVAVAVLVAVAVAVAEAVGVALGPEGVLVAKTTGRGVLVANESCAVVGNIIDVASVKITKITKSEIRRIKTSSKISELMPQFRHTAEKYTLRMDDWTGVVWGVDDYNCVNVGQSPFYRSHNLEDARVEPPPAYFVSPS